MANIEYSRLLIKRSMTAGIVPTVPLTNNLSDFIATDIFEGELFYNVADNILYSRDLSGIVVLATGVPAPTGLVIPTDNVIKNPPALTPLKSEISLGVTGDVNRISIITEDTFNSNLSSLELYEQSNVQFAELTVDDGAGNIASSSLSTDSGGGFTFMSAIDSSGAFVTHNVTAIGGYHGFYSTGVGNYTSVWDQDPTKFVWSINDPVANITIGDNADGTSSPLLRSQVVTTSAGTSAINQFDNGDIELAFSGAFSLTSLTAFDDDADAGVGGLVAGNMYQTTGLGAAPLNVAGIVMIKQ